MRAGVWNARVLLREIRVQGYTGGYTLVTEWLRPQRKAAQKRRSGDSKRQLVNRRKWTGGTWVPLRSHGQEQSMWGFTFTLGYSRGWWRRGGEPEVGDTTAHARSRFRQLGGVPEEILYDRMKTVWLGTDERGEIVWNPVFLDFARYWGFTPRLCRPYRAQTKGKVESGVKYVRRNFLCGLQGKEPSGLAISTRTASVGVEVANQRVHGTTHEEVWSRWEVETVQLQSLARAAAISVQRTTSYAKWHGMRTWSGKAAGIRCRGSMPARKCGCAK